MDQVEVQALWTVESTVPDESGRRIKLKQKGSMDVGAPELRIILDRQVRERPTCRQKPLLAAVQPSGTSQLKQGERGNVEGTSGSGRKRRKDKRGM